MRIADQKNFFTGLFYIAFGAAASFGAARYQIGTASRMGPGYFPLIVGLALTATGLCVLVLALAQRSGPSTIGSWSLRSAGIVLAAVVLFGLLVEPMGLVVAVPVLLAVSAFAHPRFSWMSVAVSIAILLPMTWLIFVVFLEQPIPVLPSFLIN